MYKFDETAQKMVPKKKRDKPISAFIIDYQTPGEKLYFM
jgi:hypothetical protein